MQQPVQLNQHYYSYLNASKGGSQQQPNRGNVANNSALLSSMNSSNQISDSIMNWSMKISNYNNNQQYTQQQLIELHKRSKSRSPLGYNSNMPRSNSSFSKFYNRENSLEDSVNLAPPAQFQNKRQLSLRNQQQEEQQRQQLYIQAQHNKSTTSWGKLKHSKSSSSNIGAVEELDDARASSKAKPKSKPSRKQKHITGNSDLFTNSMNQYSFVQMGNATAERQETNGSSSPSLFKLFQNSKQLASTSTNCLKNLNAISDDYLHNESVVTTPSKTKVKHKKQENSQKSKSKRDNATSTTEATSKTPVPQNKSESVGTRTTSFSQLRQRSLSSCTIASSPNRSPVNEDFHNATTNRPASSTTNSGSLNQSVSTNSSQSITKKSVGIQHPPMMMKSEERDQSIQTSTIVCMLVDRHNSKTSQELMAVAARAARAAVAARRVNGLFNSKASLPDLTFLKDYADEKPVAATNATTRLSEQPQQALKASASAAELTQTSNELTTKQTESKTFNQFCLIFF